MSSSPVSPSANSASTPLVAATTDPAATGEAVKKLNIFQHSENFGKRFGWIISSASLILSAIGIWIALSNLNSSVEKNSRDLRLSTEASKQSAIAQALATLQNPIAPGVLHSLVLVARERVAVNGINLNGAYLEYGDLNHLKARDALFEHANMNAVDLTGAEIENSSFAGSQMSGSNLRGVGRSPINKKTVDAVFIPVTPLERDPRRVIISYNTFRMDFTATNLANAAFDDAVMQGASFKGANLYLATFIGADLAEADFTDANTTGANFSKANISTKLIKQEQIDAACAAVGQEPIVLPGIRPPSKICK